MNIAIASGKGGTGKTTIAVSLALAAPRPVRLLDCDVEAPNCHIFLKPEISAWEPVGIPIPVVDKAKCTACGACSGICQYHAIVVMKTQPLVFPEMCHGCGGCAKVCPTGAISEVSREMGVVESGRHGAIEFVQGRLQVGNPMAPPLIRAVKRHTTGNATIIIDCPPGTSCPVIAAVRGSDFALLVTEPTPFGLHDLGLAVETVRQLGMPFGVIINRANAGDTCVTEFCRKENIAVLLEVPEDRRVAETISNGGTLLDAVPGMRAALRDVLAEVHLRCATTGAAQ